MKNVKGKIPTKTKEDFQHVMSQEGDRYYIAVNGNLFSIEDNVLFSRDEADKYALAVCRSLKEDMETAKSAMEYDTIYQDMIKTYTLRFRIH